MASPAYQTQQQTVSGTVESVNPKGIKLNGEWHNISKFAQDVTIPSRGEFATLTLDKSGFVRSVETSGGGGGSAPTSQPSQKDRTITRLAVLKAAAEFAASRPEAKSSDVLKIADLWYAWAVQEEAE